MKSASKTRYTYDNIKYRASFFFGFFTVYVENRRVNHGA
jgi:hypothetical protein